MVEGGGNNNANAIIPDDGSGATPPTPPPPPPVISPVQQNNPEVTLQAVQSAKREVVDALADVEAAFDAHVHNLLAEHGGARVAAAKLGSSGSLPPNVEVLVAAALARVAGNGTVADGEAAPPPLPSPLGGIDLERKRAERLRIFRTNLRSIQRQNARSGDTLAFGITPFSHLTPAEFRSMYLAPEMARLRKDADAAERVAAEEAGPADPPADSPAAGRRRRALQQYNDPNALQCKRQIAFPSSGASLPAAFDWRDVNGVNYVARVRNQGSCGSCAAFAVNVAYEATVMRKYGDRGYTADRTDLSEQRMLNCWPGDQCRGALPHWYADLQVCKGVSMESAWPYTGVDRNTCPSGSPARFASGATAWAYAPTTPQGYASAILRGPLPFGLAAAGSAFMNYKAGVFDCRHATTSQVDHAVTLVGWNDQVRVSTGATWQVFVGKNSWSTAWGEGGFFRVRKDCQVTSQSRGPLAMYSAGYAVSVLD
jgi:hypothetical protein